ncbi:MAG: hypothetical protein ABI210_07775 [Abditibacteriaceae bacterium]
MLGAFGKIATAASNSKADAYSFPSQSNDGALQSKPSVKWYALTPEQREFLQSQRMTFAENMLDAGIDIVAVQKMREHKLTATIAQYDRRGERIKIAASTTVRFSLLSRKMLQRCGVNLHHKKVGF